MLVPALTRGLVRTVAAVLLVVGAGAVLAGPAAAHVSLTGTTPAAGSRLDAPPAQVELTYSAALLEVGNAVQVAGPSGPLDLEPVQVAERALVQPLPADLPPGEYTVQWRAASGDGHPIEGTFAFTSTAAASSSAPAATTSADGTEPSTAGASSSAGSDPTSDQDRTSDPTSDATDPLDPSGSTSLPVWAGAGVALLAAAGVAVAALRRGRRPGDHE